MEVEVVHLGPLRQLLGRIWGAPSTGGGGRKRKRKQMFFFECFLVVFDCFLICFQWFLEHVFNGFDVFFWGGFEVNGW